MSASKGLMQAASGVSTGPGAGNAWDVSTARWLPEDLNFAKFFTFESFVTGIFFKPDGTKLFMSGFSDANGGTGNIHEFNLSTAFDLATISFVQSLDISAREEYVGEIFFKPDGTKMFFIGAGSDNIVEYDLSTAWDISSASFSQSLDISSQESGAGGLFFQPDGTGLFITGSNGDEVNQFSLSTAWDVSSASFVRNFSVGSQDTQPLGLSFKPDGTKMYIAGSTGDNIYEYSLSSAYDISSASFSHSFDVSSQESGPRSVIFKSDGTKMYVAGLGSDAMFAYDLSTAWDISSASYQGEPTTRYFDFSAQEIAVQGLFLKPDGAKMYICGSVGDDVNEYDLSTAWDISSASFNQNFSVASQDIAPTGLFFKPDGLKMYVVGAGDDDINEYDLSTAWDVSSASYLQNFSVASQDTSPQGLFFKPDGLKMYLCGVLFDFVYEYDLSTAWDISSASYLQNFSVVLQDTTPQTPFFKPDGLKMYMAGGQTDSIYEYDL